MDSIGIAKYNRQAAEEKKDSQSIENTVFLGVATRTNGRLVADTYFPRQMRIAVPDGTEIDNETDLVFRIENGKAAVVFSYEFVPGKLVNAVIVSREPTGYVVELNSNRVYGFLKTRKEYRPGTLHAFYVKNISNTIIVLSRRCRHKKFTGNSVGSLVTVNIMREEGPYVICEREQCTYRIHKLFLDRKSLKSVITAIVVSKKDGVIEISNMPHLIKRRFRYTDDLVGRHVRPNIVTRTENGLIVKHDHERIFCYRRTEKKKVDILVLYFSPYRNAYVGNGTEEIVNDGPQKKWSDFAVGDVVDARIVHIMEHGLLAELSHVVCVFVPTEHYTDISTKGSACPFSIGMSRRARVLSKDNRRSVEITFKSELIRLKNIVFDGTCEVNTVTTGYVAAIEGDEARVRLFGGVQGFIKNEDISGFYVGKIVQVKVRDVIY